MIRCHRPGHLEKWIGDSHLECAVGIEYLNIVGGKVRYPVRPGQWVECLECWPFCAGVSHSVEKQARAFASREAHKRGSSIRRAKVCHQNIAGLE